MTGFVLQGHSCVHIIVCFIVTSLEGELCSNVLLQVRSRLNP